MNANGLPTSGQQTRKKRAVVAFEYLRWSVDQGVPYKLHEALNGEFLSYCYNSRLKIAPQWKIS